MKRKTEHTIEALAEQIADRVLPQARDKLHHDALAHLLVAFAAEIKREKDSTP